MATPKHTKRYKSTFNSQTIASATAGVDVSVDSAETTTSADATKTFLQGKYGWTANDAGPADFTNTTGADEVLFAGVTSGSNAWSIQPTQTTANTAPKYSGNVILTGYSLSFDQANAAQFTAAYQGTGALTRAESYSNGPRPPVITGRKCCGGEDLGRACLTLVAHTHIRSAQ